MFVYGIDAPRPGGNAFLKLCSTEQIRAAPATADAQLATLRDHAPTEGAIKEAWECVGAAFEAKQ